MFIYEHTLIGTRLEMADVVYMKCLMDYAERKIKFHPNSFRVVYAKLRRYQQESFMSWHKINDADSINAFRPFYHILQLSKPMVR